MNYVAQPSSLIDDAGLRALSRAFAADAAQVDREASFPAANIGRLREAGLLALTVPSDTAAQAAVWSTPPVCSVSSRKDAPRPA